MRGGEKKWLEIGEDMAFECVFILNAKIFKINPVYDYHAKQGELLHNCQFENDPSCFHIRMPDAYIVLLG